MAEIRSLTGLRWLLALWVFFFHARIHLDWLKDSPAAVERLIHSGALGVTGFFILSGFILAHVYLTEDGKVKGGLKRFWQARFARIWPLTAVSILIMAPVWLLTTKDLSALKTVLSLTSALTLMQAWFAPTVFAVHGGTWSLSVEAFFYACFPFLAPLLSRLSTKKLQWVLLVLWLFSGVVGLSVSAFGTEDWSAIYASPFFRLPEFLGGVTLGLLYNRHRHIAAPFVGWLGALSAVFLALGLSLVGYFYSAPQHNFFVVPLLGLLIYGVARREGSGQRSSLLGNRLTDILQF